MTKNEKQKEITEIINYCNQMTDESRQKLHTMAMVMAAAEKAGRQAERTGK